MTSNIQKAFKTKSKLRGMADGGQAPRPTPEMLGSGMAQRAASALQGRRAQLDATIDAVERGEAPPPRPVPTAPAPADKPKKSTLRSLFGLADGGKVKGKGGPTDDKVGPVMLSDGEYVLPADTVEIVGRDKLDALRLATHDFVDEDNKPKVSGLRKMANGGTFYVDSEGVARRGQIPPGRAVVPYQPPGVPPTAAAANPAAKSLLRTIGNVLAKGTGVVGAGMAAKDMYDNGVNLVNSGDLLASGATFAGPVGIAAAGGWGVGRAIGDSLSEDTRDLIGEVINKGVRNVGKFFGQDWGVGDSAFLEQKAAARRAGADTPAAPAQPQSPTPVADVLGSSAMANETNRRTGGGADGVYPGAMKNRSGLPNAALSGADPNSYYASRSDDTVIGTFNGRPITKGEADARAAGLATVSGIPTQNRSSDPFMEEMRSALRNLGGGVGAVIGGGGSDNARKINEINARYDALLRDGAGRNRVRGLDWSQRHGLDLERARALELGELARNQSALRGQDLQAATAANSANLQARMQALQTLGTMANQRSLQNAQAQAAQLKALQDAQTAARQGEEKGFERYTSAIGRMFIGPDGKPDAAEQERFTSFLQASDPQAYEKFTAMSPQDQMVMLQNFKTLYDMQKARNATAKRGGGAITNRADMPVDVREATWNDVWNNNLPLGDYIWSNLPFTNPNVVVTESGQPTLISDYATTGGNWDADKLELIRQRTGKDREGRSALRGD